METEVVEKRQVDVAFSIKKIAPSGSMELPLYSSGISAGFPSPADDYVEMKLDLNKHLVDHPSATYYVRVAGNSMLNAGICNGDMLVVDRAIEPKNNDVAVCVVDGEFTVKRISKINECIYLIPENPDYKPIRITEGNNFEVWGVVQYIIHKPR
jgi:DNA polymerase V